MVSLMDMSKMPESQMTIWITYGIIGLIFVLLFVFRNTLTRWKENLKATIRKQMYTSFFGKSGMHGTEIHEDGFFASLAKFLDDGFLAPSEAGPDEIYDYLMEDFEGMKSSKGKSAEEDEDTRIHTNHLNRLLREIEEDAESTDEEDNHEEDVGDEEESEEEEDDMD
jgi:hypothetical protein